MTEALGFTRGTTPCDSTFHDVFTGVTIGAFEEKFHEWAQGIVETVEGPTGRLRGYALDGKTLRGSTKQGAPGTYLLALVSHHLGLTVLQHAVDDKTNEIRASLEVLRRLIVTGAVLTVDALVT